MSQLIPRIFAWFVETFSDFGILFSKYSLLDIHLCSLKPYLERVLVTEVIVLMRVSNEFPDFMKSSI